MTLPESWHNVTPRIVVDDVAGLAAFLRRVFGATGELRADRPTVMRIGDSVIMGSAGPRQAMPAFLHVYVDDADAAWRRGERWGQLTRGAGRRAPRRSARDGAGPLEQPLADRDVRERCLSRSGVPIGADPK